ncbi:MAG: hypothetical protein OXQ28_11530, partial [Acidobacteriota bacterium]|nr:hypothetical protein [Acidobacteriota bacterium]
PTIAWGAGYTVSETAGSASLTVYDDDELPVLSITAGESVTEGGTAAFTVTAEPAPQAELEVGVSVTQGAGDDYLPDTLPTSVTIAAGATQAVLSIALPDDDADEPDGLVTARIVADPDRYVVTGGSAELAVHDNDLPPLTAEFVGMPESHDGQGLFEFELRFSEDFPGRLPYTRLRDEAFEVTNGAVRKAGRVEAGQNRRWTIAVRPDSHEPVTVTLPATTDCGAPGAVCTEAGRPLSNTVSAVVDGPPPLTAAFLGMPAEHDGVNAFEFELRFSEDFPGRLPYTRLRDEAFEVTHGTVQRARRVEPEQNQRWTIEVRPDSHEDVTVVLPAATDCDAAGAVCTESGRPLSNTTSATVVGSVEALRFLDGAGAERRVEPHRAAGFPIGDPVAASGPEPLAWGIDDPESLFEVDAATGQLRMAVAGAEVFEVLDDGRFRYRRTDVKYRSLAFHPMVTVTDVFGRTIEMQVSIWVVADRSGEVWLSTYEPRAGQELDAEVSDADGVVDGSVGWQWQYDDGNWVDDGGGVFVPVWRAVAGATARAFTPTEDMAGYALRAVATYADGLSGPGERDRRAVSAATDEIVLANASVGSLELLQGPLAARVLPDGSAVQAAALVVFRATTAAVEVRHGPDGSPPAVLVRVTAAEEDASVAEAMDIKAALHSTVVAPALPGNKSGTGSRRSLYLATVPGVLVRADATFTVRVDPDDAVAEADETDNGLVARLAELRVVEAPAFAVHAIPLADGGGQGPVADDPRGLLAETLALLPIGAHRIETAPPLRVGGAVPREMLDVVHAAWNRDAGPNAFYHGLYDGGSQHAYEGLALAGGRVAVSPVAADGAAAESGWIVAHGIARNFGLAGEPRPGPGETRGWSHSAERFFAEIRQEIMSPAGGPALFISHANYERAMAWMEAAPAGGLPEEGDSATAAVGGSLALTGGIDASGQWYLHSVAASPQAPRTDPPGPYRAVLYDGVGMPLIERPLRVLPVSTGEGGGWALRIAHPPAPARALRIRDEHGGLLLDAELEPDARGASLPEHGHGEPSALPRPGMGGDSLAVQTPGSWLSGLVRCCSGLGGETR